MERWIRSSLGADQIPFLRLRAFFALIFGLLGVIGIAGLGLQHLLREEPGAFRRAIVRDATSDEYFRALLMLEGVDQSSIVRPAARLRAVLATLEGNRPIIFVAPRYTPVYETMFYLVKTVSLPRPVISAYCKNPPKSSSPGSSSPEQPVAAYALYMIAPPVTVKNVTTIAPELSIVPATGDSSWTTFCSR